MADNGEDYCFAVSERQPGTAAERFVDLEIRAYDDTAKKQLSGVWQRLSAGLQKHHEVAGSPCPAWTSWKPWDWCEEKRNVERRQKYVAWCGTAVAGFLNVWPDCVSVHQSGKMLLYIEHIAAAPGNQTTDLWFRRLHAVGAALFAYAVFLSRQQGCEGRLGLHVADDSALAFYRRINAKCDGTLFYPERTGVDSPTPRGERDKGRTYFETTEAGSARWLENYRQ